jgi:hypothetical protein
MAPTHHRRSRSPDPTMAANKRQKTTHQDPTAKITAKISSITNGKKPDLDVTSSFADGLLDHNNISRLHNEYLSSEPYKYAIVEKLFQDDLLKRVKDECLSELSFSEKETDIYKVRHTAHLPFHITQALSTGQPDRRSSIPQLPKRDANITSTKSPYPQRRPILSPVQTVPPSSHWMRSTLREKTRHVCQLIHNRVPSTEP